MSPPCYSHGTFCPLGKTFRKELLLVSVTYLYAEVNIGTASNYAAMDLKQT